MSTVVEVEARARDGRAACAQVLGSVEGDAARQQNGKRFHVERDASRAEIDREAAHLPEPGFRVHERIERSLDEDPVGNRLAVTREYTALDLADLHLLVVDRGSRRNGGSGLGCQPQADSRNCLGCERRFVETIETGDDLSVLVCRSGHRDVGPGEEGAEPRDACQADTGALDPEACLLVEIPVGITRHPDRDDNAG